MVWPLPGGYVLAFNRDELLSRPQALPPQQRGSVLAPIDPEGGGTWLATNAFGLTLAALNVYEAAMREPEPPIRSRGLLVTDLADAPTLADLAVRIQQHPHLAHTRPFHLLGVDASQHALDARWDGVALTLTPAALPLLRVSAAFDAAEVRAARNLEFATLQADLPTTRDVAATLRRWFASHARNGSPRGVCMHREPLAGTVSHTQVHVHADATRVWYLAGPPCQDVAVSVSHLARS